MSNLTADGRRRNRDFQREGMVRRFSKDPMYSGLPAPQRVTLSELKLIGRDLYLDIKRRGVMLPDGTVNPAVEAHRKNAHEQLVSLQVFMQLNNQSTSQPVDLVAEMARAIEAAPAADAPADKDETKD
jgi:hypothetical protein